jgi:predicted permease
LYRRLRALLGWREADRGMADEIRFHLDMETEAGVRAGLAPADAARQARLAFGGVEHWREEGREARGVRPLLDLAGDVRYAVRILTRAPVFTVVAVLTIGLGIGANSAIFSVVNTVLLQPLPYPEPDRLVKVWGEGHSRAEFIRLRERLKRTEGVAAYFPAFDMSLGGDGEPVRVVAALVSSEFFQVLGIAPLHGRFFRPGEDRPGTEPVAVLSYGLWRDRFGSDAGLVGRTIELDGVRRTVVGIAPRGFSYPGAAVRLWVPLEINEANPGPAWGAYGHHIIGRLAPGVTRDQARAELQGLVETIRLENPVWRPDSASYNRGITVNLLQDQLVSGSRPLLGILLGAVGLVLLIACANVANLLLARGTARQRELAIRATLGAGSRRLARQLLVEGAVLALAGGAAALAIALATLQSLVGLLPPETPRLADVTLDRTAIGFTVLVTLLTGLGFGVLPAVRLARVDGQEALAGGRTTAGAHPRRLASALVSGQIALAVVLAIGAGLLLRSLGRLLEVDPGFETVQVASARLNPPRQSYLEPDRVRAMYSSLVESLQGQAGIQAAAVASQIPFDQTSHGMAIWIDGWTVDPNKLELFELRKVTPEFFRALGVDIVRGRTFGPEDNARSNRVVIVSESAVRRFWADREVLGGRVRYPWPGWMQVVGVAADVRNNDLREEALPTLYIPFDQEPEVAVAVVARTTGDPRTALAAIRTAVARQAPDVPVSDEATMARLVERSVAAPRSASRLLLGFGGLALLLGTVGTYGLVAYGVERRTREIAVRVAVGANRRRVVALVLREGLRLTLLGLTLGLLAAAGLARFLQSLLFGVGTMDPVTFTMVPVVLTAAALTACIVPAVRAAGIDPSEALKRD